MFLRSSADLMPKDSSADSSERSTDGGLVYGHASLMGRQRSMEDAVTVAPPWWFDGEYCFFGVYDGHGGSEVAEKCQEKMHTWLGRHMERAREEKTLDWEKVMVGCFGDMDEEFQISRDKPAEHLYKMIGSTAVVVLVGKEEVVVANCGDSRAVLFRGGLVLPMSSDHKPDRADEKEMIEAAGGKVINWNGWRVEGVLATSRSLGDHCLKPYLTSMPEVNVVRRSESDEFVIIATDGLFDVVSNDIAGELVRSCLNNGRNSRQAAASMAAMVLVRVAIAKGSKDNVSVIVVQLN